MKSVDTHDVTFGLMLIAVAVFVFFAVALSPRFPDDGIDQRGAPQVSSNLQQEPTTTEEGP